MTVYTSNSPKKAHAHRWSDTRRRIFHKKYACLWILIALLPFLVLRLVFFYASPFLLFGAPAENEAELRTELEFPSPGVSRSVHKQSALPPDVNAVKSQPNPEPSPSPHTESKAPIVVQPPTEADADDQESELVELTSSSAKEDVEKDEDLGLPEDNEKKAAETWQAPPENTNVDDNQGIEQVTISNASALAPAAPGECDLYDGDWVYDPEGPLYTNATCFYMQGHQNCMRNGRPDSAYMYWKWQPRFCELPRFDGKAFLTKFWGKTIGFVGDSLSRNQMQSLLCMLSQVEIPDMVYQNEGDKNVRWLFKKHQVTLATIWSPYLLKETLVELKGIEEGQSKLFTDTLDEEWTSVMKDFDVMVLSIGQWYFKSSIYIENDEIIGCHYCPGHNYTEIGFFQAYRKAVRSVLDKVTKDYQGLAIMSTFALEHFENGSWDNGGACRREQPLKKEEWPLQGLNYDMHEIVMQEYQTTVQRKKRPNKKVQLGLLDVTKLSLLRADGHPGPFRDYHPFEGKPPGTHVQNDCLHWCLPGPVDTWNQFLVQIVSSRLRI
ncbi:xyloglucan O-acetyltransferase [Marchantia polymorpha subsp. ruderalis]|uniref:Mannan O-acetyltransferase 1 n=1 Tax=Marchantia polymorpha TaxID=3197 RepID=A0A2R6WRT0_MARPO|nr:hypothetical protein MARPO_0063s0091 [Marchantia polymorpha]BBN19153.1 hypothetical protein Mp_8g08270 [Marchantia polymorpha subsp. ruderalis]|eukprot:PTQ36559.1 hypothetical protein MARPO_0063s0091 [Marchantia polymorpha]